MPLELEEDIGLILQELSSVDPNDEVEYGNRLALGLSKIKMLNSRLHSDVIIPISSIEKSKYRELTIYSNGFIDVMTEALDSRETVLEMVTNPQDCEEKINFYRTRVYRCLHA